MMFYLLIQKQFILFVQSPVHHLTDVLLMCVCVLLPYLHIKDSLLKYYYDIKKLYANTSKKFIDCNNINIVYC